MKYSRCVQGELSFAPPSSIRVSVNTAVVCFGHRDFPAKKKAHGKTVGFSSSVKILHSQLSHKKEILNLL